MGQAARLNAINNTRKRNHARVRRVNGWMDFAASGALATPAGRDEANAYLALRTYFVGYSLTLADAAVWAALATAGDLDAAVHPNLARFCAFCASLSAFEEAARVRGGIEL